MKHYYEVTRSLSNGANLNDREGYLRYLKPFYLQNFTKST